MVLWYKPMIYDILVFKQVTRNGIIDSSSVCFENMSWFTYLNRRFKYVIIKAGQEDGSTVYGYYQHTGQWLTEGEGQLV